MKDIRHSWAKALEDVGLEHFWIYNLRHTFASRLSAAGVSDLFVGQIIGHAIFGLVSTAIEGVSLLAHYAPLVLLGGGGYLSAFTTEQLQAAAYWSIQLFEGGFAISLVFFGFDCLTMAYLIVRSTFFPRLIGVLLAIEGAGYLINTFALFLGACASKADLPLFRGYSDRGSSAVPVAPRVRRERTTMEGAGQRSAVE